MPIHRYLLKRLDVNEKNVDKYARDMAVVLPKFEINTPLRLAHFLAQCLHETGKLKTVVENMNYATEERLLKVFGSRIGAQEASKFVNNPEKIGNCVYAGRLGNGDEASGDGYRYRGRELLKITGKTLYRTFSKTVQEDDILANPDLVATRYAVRSAAWYWDERKLNLYADCDDVREITLRIVGDSLKGLSKRKNNLYKIKALLTSASYTYRVTTTQVNLRNKPEIHPSTRIGRLPQDSLVTKLDDTGSGWYRVQTLFRGKTVEGFVAKRYLEKISSIGNEIKSTSLLSYDTPIAHMTKNHTNVARQIERRCVHPFDEAGRERDLLRTSSASEDVSNKGSVFISYSHADKEFAKRLAVNLTQDGCRVWIDEGELNVGDRLMEKISAAINETKFVIVILSNTSVKSEWVKVELELAMSRELKEKRIVVLPVVVEDVELPAFLKGKLYADFKDPTNYRTSLSLLTRSIARSPH